MDLPTGYTGKKRMPVVLYFHGWCDDWTCPTCKFSEVGNEKGYITVRPKGMSDCIGSTTKDDSLSWNMDAGGRTDICKARDVTAWQYRSCKTIGREGPCNSYTCYDDVWFVSQLIKTLDQNMCVDTARIYATGSSNGAMFLFPLAAQLIERKLGPRLAGIAPWYGSPFRNMLDVPAGLSLTPIMLSHGIRDTEIPIDSRESDDGYYYTPMSESLDAYAKVNGCGTSTESVTTPYDRKPKLAGCQQHTHCPRGGNVMFCQFHAAHGFWTNYAEEMTWWFFSQQQADELNTTVVEV